MAWKKIKPAKKERINTQSNFENILYVKKIRWNSHILSASTFVYILNTNDKRTQTLNDLTHNEQRLSPNDLWSVKDIVE